MSKPILNVARCLLILLLPSACWKRPAPPQPYLAFVANGDSNTIAAVDLGSFGLVASVPVPPRPEQVSVRPNSHELYAVSASGSISVIGFPGLRVLKTLRVGQTARDLVFSADGSRAYVTDPAAAEVVFLDGRQGRVPKESGRVKVDGRIVALALTPDGKTLVISDAKGNRLIFLNAETRDILGSVEVGKSPGPMVVVPDSSKVFVADRAEEKISAADIASRQILSHIEIGYKPSGLVLKPDGGELFVLSADSAMMTIVDTFHDDVEQSITTGKGPVAAVFRRNSSVLYIANSGDGSVMALDVQNRVVLNSTHVGTEPRALALTPDERFLLVADSAGSSLALLRADPSATDRKGSPYLAPNRSVLLDSIPVGSRPVDVAAPDWVWQQ